ncbi:MAG: hypothetical protein NTV52_34750 [Acidobacteria bacterium]|nr:hypothetical protein [Acidobacteriota bacterium]
MKKQIVGITLTLVAVLASCAKKDTPQMTATANAPIEAEAMGKPVAPPPVVRESKFRPVGAAKPPAAAAPASSSPSAPVPVPVPVPMMNSPVAETPRERSAPVPVAPPAPPPPPVPMKVTIKEGSVIAVRLGETLNSEKNHIGDAFTGSLAEAVVVDGMVIAERGARVSGKIVDAERAGRVKGVAVLQLALTEINTADNQRVAVLTDAFLTKGPDTTKSDVAKVGIAAGIGAAIGAIVGGGKGAAIGAGAGGAAGTGGVLATRGKPAILATETLIRFKLTQAVTITEKL